MFVVPFVTAGVGDDTVTAAAAVTTSELAGNKGSDTLEGTTTTKSTVYGAGAAVVTDDGADSLAFVGVVSASSVQGNGGSDTIDFTAMHCQQLHRFQVVLLMTSLSAVRS